MKKSKAILILLRLPFLVVSAGAVFVGTAFAWKNTGQFNLVFFLLTFLGACFLHIACNVANDYFDENLHYRQIVKPVGLRND